MRRILLALALLSGLAAPLNAQAPAPARPPQPASQVQDAAYYFLLGRYLEGKGQIDAAIAAHKKAIELEPSSAELRAELAGLYARQDRAVESLDMAEEALKLDPENREANRILGSVYAALAEQHQALRPGDNPADYARRGIAALEKARGDDADIAVELTLGRLYVQTGAFAKAVPLLERVSREQPGYAEVSFLLASAQEGAGRIDAAIATLRGTLEDNPQFFRGYVRLGELFERQQRWSEAAEAFGRAQTLNPRATALTGNRAAALINAGQPGKAQALLQPALARPEPDPALLYLMAEAQRALHDLTAAEATAQKLLTAHPNDVRGLHVMSLILQDKGDIPGAERALRGLIAQDPLDANALNSLGYMLAERGERLEEAVELLLRAVKIEPDNPSYLDSLGWAYFRQGRLELADPPLTNAATKLKDSSVVQEHLGDLRFRQQRYADAAAAWERALAGDGQSIDRAKIEKKIRDARARMELR